MIFVSVEIIQQWIFILQFYFLLKYFNLTWFHFTSTIPDILCYFPFISSCFDLMPFMSPPTAQRLYICCIQLRMSNHVSTYLLFLRVNHFRLLKSVFFFRVIWAIVFFSSAETFIPWGQNWLFFFPISLCTNPKMKTKSMWIGCGSIIFLFGIEWNLLET